MSKHVEIEDIEEMRRCAGIEDIELREAIHGLRSGDHVKLTVRADATTPGETLLVRITQIRGPAFRGLLVEKPTSPRLSGLQVGSPLSFTASHIHSLPKGQLPDEP
jgi:hypothetical protein